MVWNDAKDEALCKEILLFELYQYKERTKEKGNCWKLKAENLNQIKSMSFKVDQRAVRERYKLIRANYEDKEEEEEKASDIATEHTPLDEAFEDIVAREKEFAKQHKEEDQEKAEKLEKREEECRGDASAVFGDFCGNKNAQKGKAAMIRMMRLIHHHHERVELQAGKLCCIFVKR